jgi:radical SAM superfamily enzyme YgiQ (UPF0313 family)
MGSRILLVSVNRCDFPYPVFPLGLAMVDTALRRAGHATRWYDCAAPAAPLAAVLREFRPDYVGLSLRNIDDVVFKRRQTYYGALLAWCRELRQLTDRPLILGGSGFSIFPETLLTLTGADYGIVGEGESALVQLIAALEQGQTPAGIPGLVSRQDGRVVIQPRTAQPPGAWGQPVSWPADLAAHYLRVSSMLNVQTQRGCPFECCYCTYPWLEGARQRRREPEAVAEDFAAIARAGGRYAFVVDSVFNSSPAHVQETCEALLRRGLKLAWGCFLRPQGLTRDLMRLMARAGLRHIEFGTDSFCDRVLAAYGKHFTFADILRADELARAEQVDCCHFVIAGGPGETAATLREGFANSRRLTHGIILALPGMRVYPGTPLHALARQSAECPADADLLEPWFYFSPELTPAEVSAGLQAYARESPRWIVNEPGPEYAALAAKLRARGVVGPLWSYLALLRRVLPQPA